MPPSKDRAVARLCPQARLPHHQVMDATHDMKQQLPYPYNQDLSGILRHLNRRTPFMRARLANDPVTAAYLAAAMRLIEQRVGPAAERQPVDPEDPNSIARPLFKFLSQREVVAEMESNPPPFVRRGSVPTMRATWKSQSDFIADVLNFALWPGHRPSQFKKKLAVSAERLIDSPDFAQAVHDLAYYDMITMLSMPSFRLMLVAVASAEGDESIKNSLTESWRASYEPWKQLYGAVLSARKLQFRAGITLDEFADMLNALAAGTRLHAVGEKNAQVIDHDPRRSLLGKAALALILGCVESTDGSTGKTIEEAANILVGNHADDMSEH